MSELTAYAEERYQIREEHRWAAFPGFSVLRDPHTGKWIALLMRQWDGESGRMIERCDLKCGRQSLREFPFPWLSAPVRMIGGKWAGLAFDERTDPGTVFRLFDRALHSGEQRGYTFVLGNSIRGEDASRGETPLPFSGGEAVRTEAVPKRLRDLRRLYVYGRESPEKRAETFRRQAVFMQDYEDDVPWQGDFVRYFPTYQDLRLQQLRGYFTWRAGVRRGEYAPIPASAAYLYVYELLNGVGASSPEDSLRKLRAFEKGFLDSGAGDPGMRRNLRRWMTEFAVVYDLPPELAREAADPELLARDSALSPLRRPEAYTDEELFSSLLFFAGKKAAESPVFSHDPERGRRLFCAVWRAASAYSENGRDLFALCFGERVRRPWTPLANAVCLLPSGTGDRDYALDWCRRYRRRSGLWETEAYEKLSFDRERYQGFIRRTDARLRRALKVGRPLRENPADAWVDPFIDAALEAERRLAAEAVRREILPDLSGLDRIRRDADTTRDSLLTEEELFDEYDAEELPAAPSETPEPELPLDSLQVRILRALLEGRDPRELLKEQHVLPSLAADLINEALFDEFGDSIVDCEDDRLSLAEDYREDLERMLGGT